MLKKTLIATATAGLIAAGSLVGTAGTASAANIQIGGPGWHVGIGGGPGFGWNKPRYVCQPVFKTVKLHDHWGRPYFKKIAVSQTCFWTYAGGPGPRPGPWNGPGPGPWNGPGGPGQHHGPGNGPHW